MKLVPIKHTEFERKEEVQNIVENHLDMIFKLDKIESEFELDRYKLDTLCFNHYKQSFTAIEYKRNENISVIDQGTAYLNKMNDRKSDLVLAYNDLMSNRLNKNDFDWDKLSVLFIAPKFNIYQIDNASEKIQLCEYQNYENKIINFDFYSHINKGLVQDTKTFKIVNFDETEDSSTSDDYFESNNFLANKLIKAMYEKFTDIEFIQKADYVSARVYNKGLCYIRDKRRAGPLINIERGYIIKGRKSKNFFTVNDDPNNIALPDNWVHNDGRRGYRYKIFLNSPDMIEPTIKILEQKADTLRHY